MNKILLDTNLWIYFYAKEPFDKLKRIKSLITENFQNLKVLRSSNHSVWV